MKEQEVNAVFCVLDSLPRADGEFLTERSLETPI